MLSMDRFITIIAITIITANTANTCKSDFLPYSVGLAPIDIAYKPSPIPKPLEKLIEFDLPKTKSSKNVKPKNKAAIIIVVSNAMIYFSNFFILIENLFKRFRIYLKIVPKNDTKLIKIFLQ